MGKATKRKASESLDHVSEDEEVVSKANAEIVGVTRRQHAIENFVLFSAALVLIPLSLMYATNRFVFKDQCHMSDVDATIYSAIVAIASCYGIVAAFIYAAYKEDQTEVKVTEHVETEERATEAHTKAE